MTVEGKPAMGFSIAVEGKDSEGTMGGFVTLTYNGITQNGFLTNYHVVQAEKSAVGEDIRFEMDRSGNSPDSPNHNTSICLSEKDKEATFIDAKSRIEKNKSKQEAIEKKIDFLKNIKSPIGEVYLSSGISLRNNRALDWAFVKLLDDASHIFAPNNMRETLEETDVEELKKHEFKKRCH
jgi:hypothetical protein